MLNQVCLCGRLTDKIELNNKVEGITFANFSIAVETGKEETSFIRCVAFDKTAELLEAHTKKGDRIVLGGSIRQRKYQANDGTNREVVEVIVRDIQFVEPLPAKDEEEEIPEGYYKDKDSNLIKKSNAKKSNAKKSK